MNASDYPPTEADSAHEAIEPGLQFFSPGFESAFLRTWIICSGKSGESPHLLIVSSIRQEESRADIQIENVLIVDKFGMRCSIRR